MGMADDLLMAFPMIVLGAELFTNAVEQVGVALGVSEGVMGSLLAAVGTVLPEAVVPVLAALHPQQGSGVAVGAILGAPLMLSTLTVSVLGVAALIGRRRPCTLRPERRGLKRDLDWFLGAFIIAFAGLFLPSGRARLAAALVLVGVYVAYGYVTLRVSQKTRVEGAKKLSVGFLYFTARRSGTGTPPWPRYAQLVIGLLLILGGAHVFVIGIERLGQWLAVPDIILALALVPIATELPEKVNSIVWVRREQDTLAFGNITGALVFQGSVLPALGLLLTPWQPTQLLLITMGVTLVAVAYLRCIARRSRPLMATDLVWSGVLYSAYFGYLLSL